MNRNWNSTHLNHYYIFPETDTDDLVSKYGRDAFISFYLLLNALIPLDLAICITFIKGLYVYWLYNDAEMVNEEKSILNGEISGCKTKNLELIQDFALVNNIFCDKTGTLTQNKLIFRMLVVDGKIYKIENDFAAFKQMILQGPRDERFKNFFRCISICHDAIQMNIKGHDSYQGASQDEITFLDMCKKVGYCYCKERDNQFITIVIDGVEEKYEILRMLEFTSDRKMMSVIVKRNDGKIINFVKGADISMLPRLTAASTSA